jgi:hypothetical protein
MTPSPELPPLPEPHEDCMRPGTIWFTADQMRSYAESAVASALQRVKDSTMDDRSWPDESWYECNCVQCQRPFYGHKRVVCKDCAATPSAPAALPPVSQEPAGWFEAPHGAFRVNPTMRLTFPPQSLAWAIPVYLAAPAASPAPAAEIVGDTRFEGWLSCHEPDRTDGRSLRYTKQDMRDSYWAGYCERGSFAASSPAPAPAAPAAPSCMAPDCLANLCASRERCVQAKFAAPAPVLPAGDALELAAECKRLASLRKQGVADHAALLRNIDRLAALSRAGQAGQADSAQPLGASPAAIGPSAPALRASASVPGANGDLRRELMQMARCDDITDAHRVLIGRVIGRLGEQA